MNDKQWEDSQVEQVTNKMCEHIIWNSLVQKYICGYDEIVNKNVKE